MASPHRDFERALEQALQRPPEATFCLHRWEAPGIHNTWVVLVHYCLREKRHDGDHMCSCGVECH